MIGIESTKSGYKIKLWKLIFEVERGANSEFDETIHLYIDGCDVVVRREQDHIIIRKRKE